MSTQDKNISSWIADNKLVLLLAVCSFAMAFGLRAVEYGSWSNPAFSVDGEYIMGTHDAYYWLAGAKGVGSAATNPMAGLLRFLHAATGAQYANIAFWLPAVFAGLCALAAFGWGMLISGPWAGLTSAVYATSIPAYFFRTRLSYYDTDIITLFFPLLISFLLAVYLLPGLRRHWFAKDESEEPYQPRTVHYIYMLLSGALTSYGAHWHGDVRTFGVILVLVAIGLAVVCARKDCRAALLRGLLVYAYAAFCGLPGLALAVIFIAALHKNMLQHHKLYNNWLVYLGVLVLTMLLSGVALSMFAAVFAKISSYLKPVAAISSGVTGPKYPGVAQSVIEAQNIPLEELFFNMSGNATLGMSGFILYFLGIAFYPLLILLLPFAASTLGGMYLGGRFVMFGGIVTGLGLFLCLVVLMKLVPSLKKYNGLLKGAQAIVLIVLLIVNLLPHLATMAPTPIMGAPHAKALIETGKKIKKDSTVWTWWDWGYATMYYAGVRSFADGGNHAGPVLYPLAYVLTTPIPVQSAQAILFSAENDYNPAKVWDKMSSVEVENMLANFGRKKFDFKKKADQYVVVNWENLNLAYWILYYGAFDLVEGNSKHPQLAPIRKAFDLDFKTGELKMDGQQSIFLNSCDVMEGKRSFSKVFNQYNPYHLIYDKGIGRGFICGSMAYNSMMVRLLLGDPFKVDLADQFELVYDGYPDVRVYKVR